MRHSWFLSLGWQVRKHADWLAISVLDRYRKVQNQIDVDALAVPYLDIEDAITVNDFNLWTTTESSRYWIEEIDETIQQSKYEQSLSVTPLPPWPSFIPSPPPDIYDFVDSDNGRPNLVVDVKMTDEFGEIRWDGAFDPGTNYDPYESDGSSTVNNVGQTNKLKLAYKLLVGGELNARVIDKEYNQIVQYIVGGGDQFGTNITYERRGAGDYEELWDAIDFFGTSRILDDPTNVRNSQDIVVGGDGNLYPGIFAKGAGYGDGRYYVEFEFNAFEDSYHTDDSAYRIYSTEHLPRNLNSTDYGNIVDSGRMAEYWRLELGTQTRVRVNSIPDAGELESIGPRTNSSLLGFTTQVHPESGVPGIQIWMDEDQGLSNPAKQAMANRQVKFDILVDYSSFMCTPTEENTYTTNDGNDIGVDNNNWGVIDYPGGPGVGFHVRWDDDIDTGPVGINDGVVTETQYICQASVHSDQYKYNRIVQLKNLPRKPLNGGEPFVSQRDSYTTLANTKFSFDPTSPRVNHVFNKMPSGSLEGFHSSIVNNYTIYYKDVGGLCGRYSDQLGYRAACLVFAAKWYNFVYDIHDKSGRSVFVASPSYDGRSGIGMPSTTDYVAQSPYAGKVLIRAHWIPRSVDSTPHSGGFFPGYSYLDPAEAANYAFQDVNFPAWANLSDPNGQAIQNHPMLLFMGDLNADVALDASTSYNSASVGAFESAVSQWAFYAWPIHHYWPSGQMSTNKQNWSEDPATDLNQYWLGHCPENSHE